jgi:predicted transcriptional regulator YdeE
MPVFRVEKSVLISAPVEKVYEVVRDFKQWVPWSPWVIAEPDCPLTYAEDGKSYSWDGKIIGAGEMTLLEEDAPGAMRYRLKFLRPWKSESAVSFTFVAKEEGTEVTWSMDGSLPFFMFWMKSMMTTFVGMDYERGLNMLKDYVETGAVPSALAFPGTTPFGGCRYVGVETECKIAEIGPAMERDFTKMRSWLDESGTVPVGLPFSIYRRWDVVKGKCAYAIGFPVDEAPRDLPGGFVMEEAPACEAYVVRHTGAYRHLGNAWSAGYMHARSKVFAQNKKIFPFEIYENNPEDVAEADLVTVVHFPVR